MQRDVVKVRKSGQWWEVIKPMKEEGQGDMHPSLGDALEALITQYMGNRGLLDGGRCPLVRVVYTWVYTLL